mmetsp:Transcript_48723/g.104011  ORF Transcript_48723/g.104011 Transcript_48723/m.104011 type:complete len:161 (+) Transcript_48723:203-685(+)|eukprot:CAMPEP_0183351660 /NCGR_PEP_ID=MMETSP0164_2-20130417/26174_1 /TAXON_ID=221442 /ORGANISM="Coccolithus pelagicus ssp braarudi, Strain PLY182g" /LENGTH=160 /DNA_ID=CAMNT_0025523899 /DNA_START=153 /DNA_END=635 /DNA_ORIENTATION=-
MASELLWVTGQGTRAPQDTEPLPQAEAAALSQQVRAPGTKDKDRLRLIRNTAVSYTLTCTQISNLITALEFSDARVALAAELFGQASDPHEYETVVLAVALRFEDERAAVRQRLGNTNASSKRAIEPPKGTAKPIAQSAPKDEASWMRPKPSSDSDEDSD